MSHEEDYELLWTYPKENKLTMMWALTNDELSYVLLAYVCNLSYLES
jgi:hypothetical protein